MYQRKNVVSAVTEQPVIKRKHIGDTKKKKKKKKSEKKDNTACFKFLCYLQIILVIPPRQFILLV